MKRNSQTSCRSLDSRPVMKDRGFGLSLRDCLSLKGIMTVFCLIFYSMCWLCSKGAKQTPYIDPDTTFDRWKRSSVATIRSLFPRSINYWKPFFLINIFNQSQSKIFLFHATNPLKKISLSVINNTIPSKRTILNKSAIQQTRNLDEKRILLSEAIQSRR